MQRGDGLQCYNSVSVLVRRSRYKAESNTLKYTHIYTHIQESEAEGDIKKLLKARRQENKSEIEGDLCCPSGEGF